MKINLLNTRTDLVNATFRRDEVESFPMESGKKLETDYHTRVFKFADTMGQVMKHSLTEGTFIIDEKGLRKEHNDVYLTTWYKKFKVNIVNETDDPVQLLFKRESSETHTLKKSASIITDYNNRQFKFIDKTGRVMNAVLQEGDFAICSDGLRGEIDRLSYAKWNKADNRADKVIAEARKHLGTPYKYGGTDPVKGIDCSALMQYTFQQAVNIRLPRTANGQWNMRLGKKVSIAQLQRGDLVFFQKPGYPAGHAGHVGVYIGNGKMINSQCNGGVVEANIHARGYGALLGGRRIL